VPVARGLSPDEVRQAIGALRQLGRDLPTACRQSQAFLLGSRDPNGPSCVRPLAKGATDAGIPPVAPGDANGGPGKRLLQLCYWDEHAGSPLEELRWQRGTFRPFLRRLQEDSAAAARMLAAVQKDARALADLLEAARECPTGLVLLEPPEPSNWPLWCLHAVAQAGAKNDLPAARRWARELAAAVFALEDLHRWVEFLVENQLTNHQLQELCEGLFEDSQTAYGEGNEPYTSRACVSRFPGGNLQVANLNNYMEAERQAEGLLRPPSVWAISADETAGILAEAPGAVWMPPDLRASYAKWRAALSPANRRTLDAAAALPFERSFLANMLHRCRSAGTVENMAAVLARFSARRPAAAAWEILDILPYRAGLAMSGIEWGDRFDPRVMKMSVGLEANSPRDALLEARRMQYEVYGGSKNYKNLVLTLRKALDTRQMDCIRATDLIAALYRNAGWPGFLHVRWCYGTNGHSVAVAEDCADGNRTLTIVDGLYAPGQAVGAWPREYFTAHRSVYCVELFGRGLDTNVFLEGYVLRGPNAGMLVKAPVPYLPGHEKGGVRRVFSPPREPATQSTSQPAAPPATSAATSPSPV
jgi:hypothetical protein